MEVFNQVYYSNKPHCTEKSKDTHAGHQLVPAPIQPHSHNNVTQQQAKDNEGGAKHKQINNRYLQFVGEEA